MRMSAPSKCCCFLEILAKATIRKDQLQTAQNCKFGLHAAYKQPLFCYTSSFCTVKFRDIRNVHPLEEESKVLDLDIFETPVTVTPQQENFKNFKFRNSLKSLTFTFGESFGERAFTLGERTFTFEDNQGFRFFGELFFCCWGVLGLRVSRWPVGFSKISNA